MKWIGVWSNNIDRSSFGWHRHNIFGDRPLAAILVGIFSQMRQGVLHLFRSSGLQIRDFLSLAYDVSEMEFRAKARTLGQREWLRGRCTVRAIGWCYGIVRSNGSDPSLLDCSQLWLLICIEWILGCWSSQSNGAQLLPPCVNGTDHFDRAASREFSTWEAQTEYNRVINCSRDWTGPGDKLYWRFVIPYPTVKGRVYPKLDF